MRRSKVSRRSSRRQFGRTASRVRGKNMMASPMRGGFRI